MATEVWAVGMMRDEVDVAYAALEHLAGEGVDGIIVADNRSTDGTLDELQRAKAELGCRVVVLEDPEPGYYQSQKMTTLARQAAEMGATWVIPFDADEVWVAPHRMATHLAEQDADIATATIYNHFCTHLDHDEENPFQRMVYRHRTPAPLVKVAVRWHESAVIHQGNHGASFGDGRTPRTVHCLEVRHFPYRSLAQFRRKAVNGAEAYAATDLPETEGAHWRQYGALLERYGRHALDEVWDTYYCFQSPTDNGMVYDPAPWMRWM